MKRKMIVIALVLLGTVVPALAILGIGDIVFDPSNYAEAIQQLIRLEQQYEQMVKTYQMVQSQYNHMLYMAQKVPVNMAARYRALGTPWKSFSATNTYGTTGAWTSAANTGSGASGGYLAATEPLLTYGDALAKIPSSQLRRVQTSYANIELTDGANLSLLETIGRLRGNATAIDTTIQNLENDSLSSTPDMNTEVAVLNKINAANLISIRTSQDANKLLVGMTEDQILRAKRQRDEEARAVAHHIRFTSEAQAVMAAQAANASAAMMAWRMP